MIERRSDCVCCETCIGLGCKFNKDYDCMVCDKCYEDCEDNIYYDIDGMYVCESCAIEMLSEIEDCDEDSDEIEFLLEDCKMVLEDW